MSVDFEALLHGYLDETLTDAEQATLAEWLGQTPENARRFAEIARLHDRLRTELAAHATLADAAETWTETDTRPADKPSTEPATVARHSTAPARRWLTWAGVALASAIGFVALWYGLGETPAEAAVAELNRLMEFNARALDRTYSIVVEESELPTRRGRNAPPPESLRPPKVSLDGATLYVRGGHQFVLIRHAPDGATFTTGSNGRSSWSVQFDGSVRVSDDPQHFRRDVPGHEHSMPLDDVEAALTRLRSAYDLRLLPVEEVDEAEEQGAEPSRLIVAVKKRGFRGPSRVEIAYSAHTGRIDQMRFVGMPYGPERLTLRMSLIDQPALSPTFFEHESHHAPQQPIEREE